MNACPQQLALPLSTESVSVSSLASLFRSSLPSVAWSVCLALLLITGCDAPQSKKPQGVQIARSSTNEAMTGEECTRQFNNVYDNLTLSPETINADPQSSFETLSVWAADCLTEEIAPVELNEAVSKILSPEYKADLVSENYLLGDIFHLRSSILLHRLAKKITEGKRTESERFEAIVNYAVSNIALRPRMADQTPRSPYEILLMGMGTLQDRLWVITELMDQNNLTPILIPVATPKDQVGNRLLISYLIGNQQADCPLYEATSGVPLVYGENQRITLTDLANRKLPEDFHLFDGTSLKQILNSGEEELVVQLPVNPSQWPTRLLLLQDYCIGERSPKLFSEVPQLEQKLADLSSQFHLPAEASVKLFYWKYPSSMLAGLPRMTAEQQQVYQSRLAILMTELKTFRVSETPDYQYNSVGTTQELITSTERRLMLARVNQLNQEYINAGRDYMILRIQGRGVVDGQVQVSQQEGQRKLLMASDAHYWTALCQFEQKAFSNARNTLIDFLNSPWNVKWQVDALELLARSCASENDYDSCLDTINQMVSLAPNDASYRILLNHWKLKAGLPLETKSDKPTETETEASKESIKPEDAPKENDSIPDSAEQTKPAETESKPETTAKEETKAESEGL